MAASNKSDPEVKITGVSAEDIAEAIAATSPAAPEVERTELAGGTIRETNTVYEDRTVNPAVDREVEYEAQSQELDGGTVLTTYGDPVGGFPEAE